MGLSLNLWIWLNTLSNNLKFNVLILSHTGERFSALFLSNNHGFSDMILHHLRYWVVKNISKSMRINDSLPAADREAGGRGTTFIIMNLTAACSYRQGAINLYQIASPWLLCAHLNLFRIIAAQPDICIDSFIWYEHMVHPFSKNSTNFLVKSEMPNKQSSSNTVFHWEIGDLSLDQEMMIKSKQITYDEQIHGEKNEQDGT